MMRKKLGLFNEEPEDENLFNDLLKLMNKNNKDYTNTFCSLMKEEIFENSIFTDWYIRWKNRLKKNKETNKSSLNLMHLNNPLVIPRNHKVEEALYAANDSGDLKPIHNLIKILKNPYVDCADISKYQLPPNENGKKYKTFCGT